MSVDFEIILDEDISIENMTLMTGFPGVGLTSTIAANFIVDSIKMDRVGYLLSEKLPPAAIVQEGVPHHPIRLYKSENILVLLSDFAIPIQLSNAVSNTILDWKGNGKHFKTIVTLEGLMTEPSKEEKEIRVFGVGSTDSARERLKQAKLEIFDHGWITGTSGLLLSEGNRLGREVICILADANPMYPDARSAAKLVESVDSLMPEIQLDLKPLYEQAEKIEENIKSQLEKAGQMIAARQAPAERMTRSYMYG